jgi:hypothetical protein
MDIRFRSKSPILAMGYVMAFLLAGSVLPLAHADEAPRVPSGRCGNGILEAGETCASCPSDCTVRPCVVSKPVRTVSVRFAPPPDQEISGVTLLLSYRSDLVSLPGSGAGAAVRLIDKPQGAIVAVNDLDYAARIVVGSSAPIPLGRLLAIEFDSCDGAAAPSATDFACTVEACATVFGRAQGCACTATVE